MNEDLKDIVGIIIYVLVGFIILLAIFTALIIVGVIVFLVIAPNIEFILITVDFIGFFIMLCTCLGIIGFVSYHIGDWVLYYMKQWYCRQSKGRRT